MGFVRAIAFILAAALLAVPGTLRAAGPDVVNLINLPADNSGIVYYAEDLGYFKDAGLDVRISAMTSSPPIISAIAGGAGDVGNAVVGSVAAARERGINVRFIAPAGMYVSTHPTGRLVVAKDSTIRTAADLNGKTIAVSGLADLTYYGVRAWLDQSGANLASVKFVELPFPAMGPAVAQHRVDAAMVVEPFYTVAKNDVKSLATPNDVIASRFMATGWIATDAWIASHRDVAARFAAVIRKTALWANAHHRESAQILLRYTKLAPEVAATMTRVDYALTLDPDLLQPPIDAAVKYGGLRPLPANELIWTPAKQ